MDCHSSLPYFTHGELATKFFSFSFLMPKISITLIAFTQL